MNEQGFKPIKKQQNEELQKILPAKNQTNNQSTKTPTNEIIKNLPTWSIEPPLEIKRGNS
jgi:hypothetical protein